MGTDEVDAETLAAQLEAPGHAVIDVRPVAAYNGWRLRGEPRGGHLPGAVSVPLAWIDRVDLESVLDERGPPRTAPVTVYGYDADAVRTAVATLDELGYDDLAGFSGFADDWAADPNRPLERLARYERLVYPEWVKAVQQGTDPPKRPQGDHVVCHVHYDDLADYEAGHVPGAIPLDTMRLESPDDWNRRSAEELEAALIEHGIRHDTTVVLYGRPIDRPGPVEDPDPGHLGAMRAAVILLYAGVEDVRILNGGLAAWTAAGYDLATEPTTPEPVADFGTDVPGRPELFIDLEEARAWLAADSKDLVSVRSRREYDAETSGYSYIAEEGHIPGAVFVPSGSDADHVEPYRNADETMRPSQEVTAMWERAGVDRDRQLAFHCGTGWRSSEAFMHAYLLGWSDIAVYDGGWFEWSNDADTPKGGTAAGDEPA